MEKKLKIEELIISFKKFFKSPPSLFLAFPKQKTGQVIIEYFILLTIIAILTVIGLSTFFPKMQSSFSGIQNAAIERIVHAGGN